MNLQSFHRGFAKYIPPGPLFQASVDPPLEGAESPLEDLGRHISPGFRFQDAQGQGIGLAPNKRHEVRLMEANLLFPEAFAYQEESGGLWGGYAKRRDHQEVSGFRWVCTPAPKPPFRPPQINYPPPTVHSNITLSYIYDTPSGILIHQPHFLFGGCLKIGKTKIHVPLAPNP